MASEKTPQPQKPQPSSKNNVVQLSDYEPTVGQVLRSLPPKVVRVRVLKPPGPPPKPV